MKILYLEIAFILLHVQGTGGISLLARNLCLPYQTCQQDSDCQEDLICSCSANCGKICKSSDEDGSQEFAVKQRTYRLFGISVSCDTFPSCSESSDCPDGKICQCHDLCGAKCMTRTPQPADHEGQCPELPSLLPCRRHDCESDHHCEKHEKCCPTLCSGKRCQTATDTEEMVSNISVTMETDTLSSLSVAICVNFSQLQSFVTQNKTSYTCNETMCHRQGSHLPVCGTNGITFTNVCHLISTNRTARNPINMAHQGPCERRKDCQGPACSTGPQLRWEWINGTIEGVLKGMTDRADTSSDRSESEQTLASSSSLWTSFFSIFADVP